MFYRRTHEYAKAIAEMERVQRMFPEWVEIQIPLGGIYLAAGDTVKAWEFYDKLAERVPRSAEAHYYRGAALGYRGRQQEALTEFRVSRKLDPNYSYPYYDEFGTLWDLGQREQAIQVLQQWVDLHPNDPEGNARLQEARARMTPLGSPLGTPPGMRPR
jgi:tetratricopeptide (TPR) repeat protein